jgi:hypothetical protein
VYFYFVEYKQFPVIPTGNDLSLRELHPQGFRGSPHLGRNYHQPKPHPQPVKIHQKFIYWLLFSSGLYRNFPT